MRRDRRVNIKDSLHDLTPRLIPPSECWPQICHPRYPLLLDIHSFQRSSFHQRVLDSISLHYYPTRPQFDRCDLIRYCERDFVCGCGRGSVHGRGRDYDRDYDRGSGRGCGRGCIRDRYRDRYRDLVRGSDCGFGGNHVLFLRVSDRSNPFHLPPH